MAVESPISVSILERSPDAKVATAAFFQMMALTLWIESPVIDLLATATTLGTNSQAVQTLRQFVFRMMLLASGVHAIVAFTPAFDLVFRSLLHCPEAVIDQIRTPFMILVPWSAFIGWRRWLQGIMIRSGLTRAISYGTFIRMSTILLVGYGLWRFAALPSLQIVAIALVCSVALEASFIHFASRPAVALALDGPEAPPLTFKKLASFHFPLTSSTLIMFLGQPIVSSAINRMPDPITQAAAWQTCIALAFSFRTVVYALPEVVIALGKSPQSIQYMRRFCIQTGITMSALMLLVGLLRFDAGFFKLVLKAEPELIEPAHMAFLLSSLMPLTGAINGYFRGRFASSHLSLPRLYSIIVSISCLQAGLMLAVFQKSTGTIAAPICLTIGMLIEIAVLAGFWQLRQKPSPVPAS